LDRRPEIDAFGSAKSDRTWNAEWQEHVEVEVEGDVAGGNGWVLTEILRTEEALFFGGDGGEVHRVWRPLRGLRVGASEFKEDSATGAVVGSSVVDAIPFGVWIDAEVVVMRGVEDGALRTC